MSEKVIKSHGTIRVMGHICLLKAEIEVRMTKRWYFKVIICLCWGNSLITGYVENMEGMTFAAPGVEGFFDFYKA